jgi:hypothetical protein
MIVGALHADYGGGMGLLISALKTDTGRIPKLDSSLWSPRYETARDAENTRNARRPRQSHFARIPNPNGLIV